MKLDNRKIVKLGDVTNLLTGYPFKSRDYTYEHEDFKLLRGDNVVQGWLRWENVKRWRRNRVDGLDDYFLQEGDVILAMDRPWIEAGLKYARISEHDLPCLLVQRVASTLSF
jgi:type I restriction enzyme S subunit